MSSACFQPPATNLRQGRTAVSARAYRVACASRNREYPLHGQASRPARTEDCYLASIPATADTNAKERSATGQRQSEGARLRRDVRAWV